MPNFRCSGIGYYQETGYVRASTDKFMMGFRPHNILDNFVVNDKMSQKPAKDGKKFIYLAKPARVIARSISVGVVPQQSAILPIITIVPAIIPPCPDKEFSSSH